MMGAVWQWLTGFEWWHYLLAVYAVGYVLTVLTYSDAMLNILPRMRGLDEWADAEAMAPRLLHGVFVVSMLIGALFWPLAMWSKAWWRGLWGGNKPPTDAEWNEAVRKARERQDD
ncbi:hypothetical protein IU449_27395 [Nocardia higoensis]|uniref:Uncharacterized protein n=1 Tax=Nocardia higoensis TaxID=228599 RepID=A0ABS0DIF3_9NOCA|nr:hypothetical protein [Nocardia higoensis]MBF6358227.1 hypothetical protein [Nocardia higoensis]